jgi:hypothetical protein
MHSLTTIYSRLVKRKKEIEREKGGGRREEKDIHSSY